MKVVFDTNVVLDFVYDREPDSSYAARLFTAAEERKIEGYLGAITVTTIHYLTTKLTGPRESKHLIKNLLDIFLIAPVNDLILKDAFESDWNDFEDAVLHQSAVHADIGFIVTRNTKDFKKANIPVYTPRDMLKAWSSMDHGKQ
jgi:predicted nucleic acid-binding protein